MISVVYQNVFLHKDNFESYFETTGLEKNFEKQELHCKRTGYYKLQTRFSELLETKNIYDVALCRALRVYIYIHIHTFIDAP